MIYIDLKGNLGNQLFEYAFARSIQEITKQKICVNTHFLSKYKPEYCVNLDKYKLNDQVIFESTKALPWYVNTYAGPIRYIKKVVPNKFLKDSMNKGRFIWLKSTYVDLPIEPIKQDYYLVGYWQSTKYFKNIDWVLKKEFEPKFAPLEHNRQLYSIIKNSESICVTIRRGDYVTNKKYRKEFFLCDTPFFLKGIEIIRRKIPNAPVICFSDDIDWVKKNVPISGEVYYECGTDPVWEKLRLMSSCKHFVISNSSFSWWAQHLSDNSQKIVCAPSKWYPDGRKCDIYEDGWILIPGQEL